MTELWAIATLVLVCLGGLLLVSRSEKRRALRHMSGREPLSPSAFAASYFHGPAVPIAEKLVPVLSRHLPVDLRRLHPDDLLIEELRMDGLDSMASAEFLMDIEREFGIKISDDIGLECYTPPENSRPTPPRPRGNPWERRRGNMQHLIRKSEKVFEQLGKVGFEGLTDAQKAFVCVWGLDGEVGNGGFDQFYFNSSGDFSVETVAALEKIGARQTAALVRKANSVFPGGAPAKDRQLRQEQLDPLSAEASALLGELDLAFYQDPDKLDSLLLKFVGEHPNEM